MSQAQEIVADEYYGLAPYLYEEPARSEYFRENGFGPFTVQWHELRNDILTTAGPHDSVHVHGCRGAGKTILLMLLGKDLSDRGKLVFFFSSSKLSDDLRVGIEKFVKSRREA